MKSVVKVVLSSFLCLCLCVTSSPFTSLTAAALIEGDYEYTITDDEATITRYLGHAEDVTVPSTLGGYPVTAIGREAFRGRAIQSITLPDGILSIDRDAFARCSALSSVLLPDGIVRIEDGAFLGCAFTSLLIPDSVTHIGTAAFASCHNLTEIIIPNSVTSMGEEVFANCDSLVSVVLSNSITTIEKSTFWECKSLEQFTISDHVTTIGDIAFSGCTKLKELVIPESVTAIGSDAFGDCKGLNIVVPASVTNIADAAFCNRVWMGPVDQYVPVPNTELTLWVYPDTVAQQHAIEHGIPFVTMLDYPADAPGDINADGTVDAADSLLALQQSVRLVALGDQAAVMADINQDGRIDAQDALRMLQYSVHLTDPV